MFMAIGAGVVLLTVLGVSDRPPRAEVAADVRDVALQAFTESCSKCHMLSGSGGEIGPDLTYVGRRLDEASIARQIADPLAANPASDMPPFKDKLTPEHIGAVAKYLASRR